ncbi:hypothetical protein NDU88_008730 [Pleurodeles waltl]|uniref:Uncharacterized protein n=1 Tax=Pleurodeles waltl TaxID=8319 RepID=A0AAV7QTB7_PLEWA|nr:hypothetical protein NDU88_008730 [Pleurodeles waltl]
MATEGCGQAADLNGHMALKLLQRLPTLGQGSAPGTQRRMNGRNRAVRSGGRPRGPQLRISWCTGTAVAAAYTLRPMRLGGPEVTGVLGEREGLGHPAVWVCFGQPVAGPSPKPRAMLGSVPPPQTFAVGAT